jgi:hypothetical protein
MPLGLAMLQAEGLLRGKKLDDLKTEDLAMVKQAGNAEFATRRGNAFNKAIESGAFNLQIFKAKMEQLSISVGNLLLPVLNRVIPLVTKFVDWVKNASEKHPKLTRAILTGAAAFAGFVTVLLTVSSLMALFTAATLPAVVIVGALAAGFAIWLSYSTEIKKFLADAALGIATVLEAMSAMFKAIPGFKALPDALDAGARNARAFAGRMQEADKATEAFNDKLKENAQKLRDVRNEMDLMKNKSLGVSGAAVNLSNATERVNTLQAEYDASVKVSGKTSTQSVELFKQLITARNDLVIATEDLKTKEDEMAKSIDTVATSKVDLSEIEQAWLDDQDATIRKLIEERTVIGGNVSELEKMLKQIEALNKSKKDFEVKMNFKVEGAEDVTELLKQFGGDFNAMDKYIRDQQKTTPAGPVELTREQLAEQKRAKAEEKNGDTSWLGRFSGSWATGGEITSGKDVMAKLNDGTGRMAGNEFVMNAPATKMFSSLLNAMNGMGESAGNTYTQNSNYTMNNYGYSSARSYTSFIRQTM